MIEPPLPHLTYVNTKRTNKPNVKHALVVRILATILFCVTVYLSYSSGVLSSVPPLCTVASVLLFTVSLGIMIYLLGRTFRELFAAGKRMPGE